MKPISLGMSMTMRFQGVTSSQLDALHKVARDLKTDTLTTRGHVNIPGDGVPFVEVTKAELRSPGGDYYTVLLTIYPTLEGWVHPPLDGKDRRWAELSPSRQGLGQIFDALGILAEEELIVDKTVPVSHGGPQR